MIGLIKGPEKIIKENIIIHTSNENSDLIYKKIFKLKNISNLDAFFFPVSFIFLNFGIFKIIRKILNVILVFFINIVIKLFIFISSYSLKDGFLDDKEIKFVYKELINKKTPFFIRNEDYYKWRFNYKKYNKNYAFSLLYKKRIVAHNITISKKYKFLESTFIMDMISNQDIQVIGKFIILLNIIKTALQNNSDFIFTLINKNSLSYKRLFKYFLIKIPSFFLPHSTPVYIKNEGSLKFNNIHLTLSDLDYF